MTEGEGTHKVSRFASTRTRIVLAVVALLVCTSVEIIVVLGKISGIDPKRPQEGIDAAQGWFLRGTAVFLIGGAAMARCPQLEIKKRLSAISRAANSIADGDLDPQVTLWSQLEIKKR